MAKKKTKTAIKELEEIANTEIPTAKYSKKFKLDRVFKSDSDLYLSFCLAILFATSSLWAMLGAKVQQSNADQLVNSYLFENIHTFNAAHLPGAHSFLIKWPLFYLIKLLGYSSASFILITIFSVLATIAGLVFILSRIERRSAVFATICLAMSSVLLMVPSQTYPGALLPVNMAMLATRNLEYLLYILSLFLLLRSGGKRNRSFWLGVLALSLLIASDKLFLGISIIGALICLVIYTIKRRMDAVNLAANWFLMAVLASLGGILILLAVSGGGITNLASASTSPYQLIGGARDLVLGLIYGLLGLLTNFGANPAYDITVVRNLPDFYHKILGLGGFSYIVNLFIFIFCLYAVFQLIKISLTHKMSERLVFDKYFSLGLLLVFSTAAALLLFMGTNHYFAVDARYLTIAFFTMFICAAVLTRHFSWSPNIIRIAGAVLLISITFGILYNLEFSNKEIEADQEIKSRNSLVAQALKNKSVNLLVGDYWRVVPIKNVSSNNLNILPLAGCTTPRNALSSDAWNPNLKNRAFAYLLSFDKSQSDYPQCSPRDITAKYGQPNSSILIDGRLSKPKELLLIYNHGINTAPVKPSAPSLSTILPVDLADLPSSLCSAPTVMNIVAHEDDDLLFINPDLLHSIQAGNCIRTIYITAGDSGGDNYYWLARQQGSEAAYSAMLGKDNGWVERTVKVSDNAYITIANPKDNKSISLVFVHLPDGGINGDGFGATNRETLSKIEGGSIKMIHAIDKQSSYSLNDLTSLLSSLMHIYQPGEIRTQASYSSSPQSYDHSDHKAVGRITNRAYAKYEKQQFDNHVMIPIKYYMGYAISELPENVSGDDLSMKENAFFNYAKYDGATCNNLDQCSSAVYGTFLPRQYQGEN